MIPQAESFADINILIVDDMQKHAATLARTLEEYGCRTALAFDSAGAKKCLAERPWSLVLLDVRLGEEDGLALLHWISRRYPNLPVVMITAYGEIRGAVEAMKIGALDYLKKPLNMASLLKVIRSATDGRRATANEAFLSRSSEIDRIFSRLERISATDIPVMIHGESGTGKELLADAIHKNSGRKNRPLIAVNCAAIPESLLDNELFGHEKGAYTGAHCNHLGFFERASGGTLFLDEIGDMPLATQSRLLRAIQNKEIWRIGGDVPISIDVRFICASHRDIEGMVAEGTFRQDLYYRLNACYFSLPPLRERRCDIELLCRHFLERFSPPGISLTISEPALELLNAYSWPGNVRELQNTIHYAVSLRQGSVVDLDALPEKFRRTSLTRPPEDDRDEKERILDALKVHSYRRGKTAESLRMDRTTLYRKMRKHGIA